MSRSHRGKYGVVEIASILNLPSAVSFFQFSKYDSTFGPVSLFKGQPTVTFALQDTGFHVTGLGEKVQRRQRRKKQNKKILIE